MVAIMITGFFSARSHWRLGHIDRKALRQLLPGLTIGAGLGLWSTLRLPETSVLLGLSAVNGWIAWDYGRRFGSSAFRPMPLAGLSGPIGFVSGMFGIGGGTMLVPLLRRMQPLRYAVGTAAVCGMAIATSSVLLNLALEASWRTLLAPQLPFLAGTGIGIVMALPFASRWSAGLHSSMSEAALQGMLRGIFMLLSAGLFLAALASLA